MEHSGGTFTVNVCPSRQAPELVPAKAWLNVTRGMSLAELRGHVVVLCFFRSSSVGTTHVVPALERLLEHHGKDPLCIIGVHTGRLLAEQDPQRVSDGLQRQGITYPVVVDDGAQLAAAYGVRTWPTLVVVRPDRTIAAVAPGEPDPTVLLQVVRGELEGARAAGTLRPARLPLPAALAPAPTRLSYPGKLALSPGGWLAIADSGNHRVLIVDPRGNVVHTVGSGLPGAAEGPLAESRFTDPQGLVWDGDGLYVCDARNNTVLFVDPRSRTTRTIAGTGALGRGPLTEAAPAGDVALRSPTALAVDSQYLYIALAGAHQVAYLDKHTGELGPLAGSGREGSVDGGGLTACFAEPSGLFLAGNMLFVADTASGAIRRIDLDAGEVETVGTAALQGPRDLVALEARSLLVTDTATDRLCRVDLRTGLVTDFYRGEGERALREPAGLALFANGDVAVADTSGQRLVRLSRLGLWLEELELRGVPAAVTRHRQGELLLRSSSKQRWQEISGAPAQALRDGDARLCMMVQAPAGWIFNDTTSVRLSFEVSRRSDLLATATEAEASGGGASALVTASARVTTAGTTVVESELLVVADAVICKDEQRTYCVPVRGHYRIPIVLSPKGAGTFGASLPLATPSGI
jgi:DNA-binding beta-propeller fold protein YncE